MTVHNIATMEQFKEAVAKNPVVILDAFATWCGPCKAIAPQVARWAQDPAYKDKTYFDVDAVPELAQELGIRAMPTFVFFKDGEKKYNPEAVAEKTEEVKAQEGQQHPNVTAEEIVEKVKAAEEKKEEKPEEKAE
ncbi:thioredoxin trx1 [Collariella sp. IMI 366227]|nr:thioredoxin trx1 [Collariella sp. IMI 366227]